MKKLETTENAEEKEELGGRGECLRGLGRNFILGR